MPLDSVTGERSSPRVVSTRIRSGSGLGDAVYLRPIAEYLVRAGNSVTVCSNYGDVFLGSGCAVESFRRDRVDLIAHYVGGKNNTGTTIWDDLCAHARITTPLHIDWAVRNKDLVRGLRRQANGRPLVVVHGGREPMGRRDRFGIELLPAVAGFSRACRIDAFKVLVGRGDQIHPIAADADLWNRTTVSDVMDIVASCDGVISMCGFPVPMAEAFGKPLMAVWSAKGLRSSNPFISTVTPKKMLTKPTSRFVLDDCPEDLIEEEAIAFRSLL